jgi:hypothetical protein
MSFSAAASRRAMVLVRCSARLAVPRRRGAGGIGIGGVMTRLEATRKFVIHFH